MHAFVRRTNAQTSLTQRQVVPSVVFSPLEGTTDNMEHCHWLVHYKAFFQIKSTKLQGTLGKTKPRSQSVRQAFFNTFTLTPNLSRNTLKIHTQSETTKSQKRLRDNGDSSPNVIARYDTTLTHSTFSISTRSEMHYYAMLLTTVASVLQVVLLC